MFVFSSYLFPLVGGTGTGMAGVVNNTPASPPMALAALSLQDDEEEFEVVTSPSSPPANDDDQDDQDDDDTNIDDENASQLTDGGQSAINPPSLRTRQNSIPSTISSWRSAFFNGICAAIKKTIRKQLKLLTPFSLH